jgi:hypothetical protein
MGPLEVGGGNDRFEGQGRQEAPEPALQEVRPRHSRPEGLGQRGGDQAPLLGQASRGHGEEVQLVTSRVQDPPDLGDLIVVLLASTLAGLRDRLHDDGFDNAAELVGDLVEIADDYLTARAV